MVLLSADGFPPDIRVQKESMALSRAGHDVFVLTYATSARQRPVEWDESSGCTVVRVGPAPRDISVSNLALKLLLPSRRHQTMVRDFAERFEIDALHVHDLYAVAPGVAVSGRSRSDASIPVIADLHENMPAAERAYRSGKRPAKRFLSGLIHNYRWMRWRESRLLQRCDRVIVVVPEAEERVRSFGLEPTSVAVVSNTEDETTFDCSRWAVDQGHAPNTKRRLVSYIGGIGPHRGLDTAIRGFAEAHAVDDELRLQIVGVRSDREVQSLRAMIRQLGVCDAVVLTPWVPSEDVPQLIADSWVCLVPHNDFEHTQTTVPHKLFQYMLCGRPVLVSDCRPLARIVNETGSGAVFRAGDSASFAERLLWMSGQTEVVAEMGRKGQAAAGSSHSWRQDAERLLELYRSIERDTERA